MGHGPRPYGIPMGHGPGPYGIPMGHGPGRALWVPYGPWSRVPLGLIWAHLGPLTVPQNVPKMWAPPEKLFLLTVSPKFVFNSF